MPAATIATTCTPATTRPASLYRPRRPAATILHRTVREHLETFLAVAQAGDDDLLPVRPAAERALREYLRCGILAHGFARVRCAACKHEYLVAFSCKVRDLCPSCGTRRMVETAAHLVDDVLPRVPFRQWVLSVPKRVRWYLKHDPAVGDGFAKVFLRLIETTLRQASPGVPQGAQFGAILFVHRFGDALNSHIHFHVLVTAASSAPTCRIRPAPSSTQPPTSTPPRSRPSANRRRHRGLRWLVQARAPGRQCGPGHGGVAPCWRLVRGCQRPDARLGTPRPRTLALYCARPALAAGRLGRLNDNLLVYRLRRPTLDGRTEILLSPLPFLARLVDLLAPPRKHRHRYFGVLAPAGPTAPRRDRDGRPRRHRAAGTRGREQGDGSERSASAPPRAAGPCSWRASTRIALYNAPAVAKR